MWTWAELATAVLFCFAWTERRAGMQPLNIEFMISRVRGCIEATNSNWQKKIVDIANNVKSIDVVHVPVLGHNKHHLFSFPFRHIVGRKKPNTPSYCWRRPRIGGESSIVQCKFEICDILQNPGKISGQPPDDFAVGNLVPQKRPE